MEIQLLSRDIGAKILGINLSENLSQKIYDDIYDALIKYQVIFFKNQVISPKDHIKFAKSFGDIESSHPIYPHVKEFPEVVVLENNKNNPPDTNVWHTDVTFKPKPAFASILYSLVIPPVGGDTMWSSMTAAYAALPNEIKKYIHELKAVHDMSDFRNNFTVGEPEGLANKLIKAHERFGSAIHPIVKIHPISKKPFLYINPGFTVHVIGMNSTESRRLLNYLYDHMNQPEFQIRFKWSENDIAMWDNRCTMHYALSDYNGLNRKMHRVTVINDKRS